MVERIQISDTVGDVTCQQIVQKPGMDKEMKKLSRLNRMTEIYQEPGRTDETYGFVTIVECTMLLTSRSQTLL